MASKLQDGRSDTADASAAHCSLTSLYAVQLWVNTNHSTEAFLFEFSTATLTPKLIADKLGLEVTNLKVLPAQG